MNGIEKIAKILRTDKDYIAKIEQRFDAITGKKNVLDALMAENESLIKDRMAKLGVTQGADAKEIYDALISKIESDDRHIFKALNEPNSKDVNDCQAIAEIAKKVAKPAKGFFIKLDKAREFLINQPPLKVMAALGYDSAEKMVASEDIYEIYSALRFVEGSEWLNNVFFKQYGSLVPEDFEEREVVVKALGDKWRGVADEFLKKKKHNISHLKELGVVFVIPALFGISGEILRMFVLILHYLYEVPFYSRIFKEIATNRTMFTDNLTSLLRGDVIDRHFTDSERSLWLVVQRYLAKDDEFDWRLFVPHINPEASHWTRAEGSLANIGFQLNHFGEELLFWENLDWVGDYYKNELGIDTLVSFNLVDTVMSLVKQKDMIKYLYHHQEALWNQIYLAYFGREDLDRKSAEYLLQGYFEV